MKLYSHLAGGLFGLIIALSAQAGDTLHLKAGTISLRDQAQELLLNSADSVTPNEPGLFVIQFENRITHADETALQSRGIVIRRYLPDDAYLVRATAKEASLARLALPHVRAVAPFDAGWKLSSELKGQSANTRTETVLAMTADAESAQDALAHLTQIAGVKILGMSGGDLTLDIPLDRVVELAKIPSVEWIEKAPVLVDFVMPMASPDAPPPPTNYVYTGFESGTKIMNFDAAYNRGYHGEGQVVGVADTGVDSGDVSTLHPDLRTQVIKGYPVGLGSDSWADPMGHGTHVAGSIVGDGKASNGKIRGGAIGAHLISLGLWSPILNNLAPGTDFDKIIGTGYPDGMRIHSNSWGSAANFGAYDSMASRVDEYMFHHQDVLVLFAAGNSGVDANHDGVIDDNSVASPGTAKNVLTVGASQNYILVGGIQKTLKELRNGADNWGVAPLADSKLSSNPDGMACFSSRGPTQDGRIKPEIVAPGTNIISTRDHQPNAEVLWGVFDDNYLYAGGTSMATPLTAGAAAVVRQYLTKAKRFGNPSAALIKATLLHSAKDLFPGQFGAGPKQEQPKRRPNIVEGYGRVDLDLATRLGAETSFIDNSKGLGTGESASMTVTVGSKQTLRATLTYSDAPAAASADKALVNDLDLKITSPSGQVTTLNDHVNNTEMLELPNLEPGKYTVTVTGTNVAQGLNGKQPYALVVGSY